MSKWWDQHRVACEVVCRPAVIDELREGEHPQKREKIALLANIPLLEVTPAVLGIAEVYAAHKLMPQDRSEAAPR